jgi:hypothetical protein
MNVKGEWEYLELVVVHGLEELGLRAAEGRIGRKDVLEHPEQLAPDLI